MFASVLQVQQVKSLRSTVFWVEAALLAGFAGLITILLNNVAQVSSDGVGTAGGQIVDVLETAVSAPMGGMLAVILAGAVMAQEYNWRSLHLWLSRGVSRRTFLAAKFLSLIVPLAAIFAVTGLVTAGLALIFADGGVGSIGDHLGDIAFTLGAGIWAVLPYAALALLLAVAGRSMLIAVGGGLALTVVAENLFVQLMVILGGTAAKSVAYLPSMLGQGLLQTEGGFDVEKLSQGTSALLLGAYTLGFLLIAALLFRRQDLSD